MVDNWFNSFLNSFLTKSSAARKYIAKQNRSSFFIKFGDFDKHNVFALEAGHLLQL